MHNSFRSVNCYLIPGPIEQGVDGKNVDETLRHLESVDWRLLKPQFRSSIAALSKHIRDEIAPKSLYGIQVSALAFSIYSNGCRKAQQKRKSEYGRQFCIEY